MAFPPVEEQLRLLRMGTVEIHTEQELRRKLERSLREGKPLRVKQGFDPTAPDIHLGHTIGLNKLRQFQRCGHTVVLIVGDYTGMVGDPSGRTETRRRLTYDEVKANARTYMDQFFKVLDRENVEVHWNGEWFSKMSFTDVMDLASRYTVAKVLARNDFKERLAAGKPISVHEFFYILMQGYDSVAIRADVEIGATEQVFNLLAGRDLQISWGQEPQVALTFPVLAGTDGKERMSKSLGNYIGVADPPADMFGKVMSVPDSILPEWFALLSDLPAAEAEALADPKRTNPRDAKERLGRILVERYHGKAAADEAAQGFRKVFADKGLPEDMPEVRAPAKAWVVQLIKDCGFAASSSEARRFVTQGGVTLYRKGGAKDKVGDPEGEVVLSDGDVLRVGKIRFARLRVPEDRGDP
ncbi:MAG: tyrosine--tRNA ligase [Planctomycetes bacterium]|jgi:tyrosyl-tRNA synthetase|nr:tyrosine--tRNA ligase [Planctomycetota bacterium]